jgi:hypothetical protein
MCLAHELGIAGFNPRKIATTATISMQATEESQEASKLGEQQHTAPKSNGQPESVRKAPERAGPRLTRLQTYFCLPAVCLAAIAAFLVFAAALAAFCFWPDFLATAFGDLSPIYFDT